MAYLKVAWHLILNNMTQEEKRIIKKDIEWLKYAIKTFGKKDDNTFCYCWSKINTFPLMEIAARHLRIKGYPIVLSYGTSKITRDCYISSNLTQV